GLMLQEELLERPTVVRLKFTGPFLAGGPTPKHGSWKDVRVRTLEDLADIVEDWVGAPNGWELTTAAQHPVTAETIRRPSSTQCPIVVNIREAHDHEGMSGILKRVLEMEKKLDAEVESHLQLRDDWGKRVKNVEITLSELSRAKELAAKLQPLQGRWRKCSSWLYWAVSQKMMMLLLVVIFLLYLILQKVVQDNQIRKRMDGLVRQNKMFEDRLNSLTQRTEEQARNFTHSFGDRISDIEDAIRDVADWENHNEKTVDRMSNTETEINNSLVENALESHRSLQSADDELWRNLQAVNESVKKIGASAAASERGIERLRSTNQTAERANSTATAAWAASRRHKASFSVLQQHASAIESVLRQANATMADPPRARGPRAHQRDRVPGQGGGRAAARGAPGRGAELEPGAREPQRQPATTNGGRLLHAGASLPLGAQRRGMSSG
ncbi:unnamed protein product, partial [Prorocentrum cordatum]